MAKKRFMVGLMGAILESNMAVMWRHRQWHHLIGRTQKPRYVCICCRTKVMVKTSFWARLVMAAILKSKMAATVGTTVMSPLLKWYKWPCTVGKLRFHDSGVLLCIESGYVEWDALTVAAILKSNMAAMWRHRRWHHLIGRTQEPRHSHLNYVCIWNRTKITAQKRFGWASWQPFWNLRWRPMGRFLSGTCPEMNQYPKKYLCAKFGAFMPICTIFPLSAGLLPMPMSPEPWFSALDHHILCMDTSHRSPGHTAKVFDLMYFSRLQRSKVEKVVQTWLKSAWSTLVNGHMMGKKTPVIIHKKTLYSVVIEIDHTPIIKRCLPLAIIACRADTYVIAGFRRILKKHLF
jgi:hypothetical protein